MKYLYSFLIFSNTAQKWLWLQYASQSIYTQSLNVYGKPIQFICVTEVYYGRVSNWNAVITIDNFFRRHTYDMEYIIVYGRLI